MRMREPAASDGDCKTLVEPWEGGKSHKGRHPGAAGEVERASFIDLTASKAKGAGEIKGRN